MLNVFFNLNINININRLGKHHDCTFSTDFINLIKNCDTVFSAILNETCLTWSV